MSSANDDAKKSTSFLKKRPTATHTIPITTNAVNELDINLSKSKSTKSNISSSSDGDNRSQNSTEKDRTNTEIVYLLRKILILILIVLTCLLSFVAYIYFQSIPYDYLPAPYNLMYPPKLEGVYEVNDKLQKAAKFLEGSILGPEFIVLKNDHLYTGTSNGSIVEINDEGKIRIITNLGHSPCGSYDDEPNCGRPLGMEFDNEGDLVVCDAYLGIYKVDIKTGRSYLLVPPDPSLLSPPSASSSSIRRTNFINDLELDDDGNVYYTDSSVFQRRDFMQDVLYGHSTGRLLRYNLMTNHVEVLRGNLNFPNGILLSKYGDYILISETSRARILKYYLKGVNSRQMSIFMENLPCLPDNLQRTERGSILIACGVVRYGEKSFNMLDFLQDKIWLRALLMKIPLKPIMKWVTQGAMVIEVDEKGRVLNTLMDLKNVAVSHSSHAVEGRLGKLGRKLFIGSYAADYIGMVDL